MPDPTGTLYFLRLDAIDVDIVYPQTTPPQQRIAVFEGYQTNTDPESTDYQPLRFDELPESLDNDLAPFRIDASSGEPVPLYLQGRDPTLGTSLRVTEQQRVTDTQSVLLLYHIEGHADGVKTPIFVSPMSLMEAIDLLIDGIFWSDSAIPDPLQRTLGLDSVALSFADGRQRIIIPTNPPATRVLYPDTVNSTFALRLLLKPEDFDDPALGKATGLHLVLHTPATATPLTVPTLSSGALMLLGTLFTAILVCSRQRARPTVSG